MAHDKNRVIKTVLILFIYSLLLNLPYFHLREFQGEEGRRVIIALDMLETGNWIVPHVEGAVYLNKPPLFNWLLAGMFKMTGNISEATARMLSVLTTFLCALSLSLFFQRIASVRDAWFILPGLIFLTFADVMGKAIKAEIDITFTLFVTLSLITWFYLHEVREQHGPAWIAGLSLAGIGVLTKGVQAPLFFYGAVFPYLIYQKKTKRVLSISHLMGLAAFLAVLSLWFVPLVNQVGFYKIIDTWLSEILVRGEPLKGGGVLKHIVEFPFLYIMAYLPWAPLIVLWIYKPLKDASPLLKKTASFALFSLLFSIPIYWVIPGAWLRYLLPVSGMLSILMAIPMMSLLNHRVEEPVWYRRYIKTVALLLILLVLSSPLWGNRFKLFEDPLPLFFIGGVLLISILLFFERQTRRKVILLLAAILLAKVSWASVYFPYHQEHLSHYRNAAFEINRLVPSDAALYDYGVDNPHIAFYLKRPIRLINSIDKGMIAKNAFVLIKKNVSTGLDLQGFSQVGEIKARNIYLVLYKLETGGK
jgi:4-amino-4-deoxy-L-arabinose transferase-like glycosyltransferase